MRVLVTGADGFIGNNLRLRMAERDDFDIVTFTRSDKLESLEAKLQNVDWVFHLAGTNRTNDEEGFASGNYCLTAKLALAVDKVARSSGRTVSVVYSSSIQASHDNAYGRSKRAAEDALKEVSKNGRIRLHIFRLPNVFGKWSRPNYNSVVATFCYNIARHQSVEIYDPQANLSLIYIDDVVDAFIAMVDGVPRPLDAEGFSLIGPVYATTVGDVAARIEDFRNSRASLTTSAVGLGFIRALYATYVSYLPLQEFAYSVPMHSDPRGVFVEVLKTEDSGQFSYFTAHPGVTRGGHYHHTKTEKFLVIRGIATFRFRHMTTGESHQITTSGDQAMVVETIPGWTHDITNVGEVELIVMLWANEMFDQERPDTYASAL